VSELAAAITDLGLTKEHGQGGPEGKRASAADQVLAH
jgi:hypothetical protein